jgi:hypothetical protein
MSGSVSLMRNEQISRPSGLRGITASVRLSTQRSSNRVRDACTITAHRWAGSEQKTFSWVLPRNGHAPGSPNSYMSV